MPWTLNTPIPHPQGDLTTILVKSAIIDNVNLCIRINYGEGRLDGEDFVEVYPKHHDVRDIPEQINELTGEVVQEATTDFSQLAMAMTPDTPETNHDYLKGIFYDALHDAGVIGDGVLS